jgi:hypothetical protein
VIGTDPKTAAGPATGARPPLADAATVVLVAVAALQPFASFLFGNAATITHPGLVVQDAVIWTVLFVGLFLAIRFVRRDHAAMPLAMGFAAFSISFWNFGRWLSFEPASAAARWIALLLWGVVTFLFVRIASRLAATPSIPRFVTIFLAVWTVASLGGFALTTSGAGTGTPPATYAGDPFTFTGDRPNVYWFILDEHARTDQLRRWTRSDNSWFGDELADRGFSVSTSSHSSYLMTHLSIPSTLNMEYVYTPGHEYHGEYAMASPIMAGDNAVVDTFEANGYRFVYAPDGSAEWATCGDHESRSCIEPIGGPFAFTESRLNLARSTPVGSFELPIAHNTLTSVLDGVDAIDTDQPLFVMAHVMSPHNPFRFAEGCGERAEWVEGHNLTGDERAAAYANDVQCLDRAFVETTDRILADDPDAVIIVQADHGSRLSFDWMTPYEDSLPSMFNERFSVLNAIRLPERCRNDSIEGLPLVNTYRLVFACLADSEPDLLDERWFFTEFGKLNTIVEVPPERFEEP